MENQLIKRMLYLTVIVLITVLVGCTEEEETFPRTRLFKPALKTNQLRADGNAIIINFSKQKGALRYKLEVSRDTFQTVDYTVEIDTNYAVLNEDLIGEELLWFTIYQVRATAYADETEYNSLPADLGSVRTEKFPSNMIAPESNDMIDTKVKVEWVNVGDPITEIRGYAASDNRLQRPLFVQAVSTTEATEGVKIVSGLAQETTYQIAVYSSGELRGWENYTTVASIYNLEGDNIRDLTQITDADAVINALSAISDGDTIVLKKGFQYNLPPTEVAADKSVTFVGALGFEDSLARLYTTGNWKLAENANIDHIRFLNLEIRGEDWTGDYVFNHDVSASVNEVSFKDCHINHVRGIMRMKDQAEVTVGTYTIDNCIINQIGGYGLVTVDNLVSSVSDIFITNTTIVNAEIGISSYTDMNSITIDGVSTNNFPRYGRWIFRFRNEGTDNATNGVSISNSIFGHAWDQATEDFSFSPKQGMENTNFSILNVYVTADHMANEGGVIDGMPSTTYGGDAVDLWVAPDPEDGDLFNFNFKDTGFSGRTNAGDSKWRTEF